MKMFSWTSLSRTKCIYSNVFFFFLNAEKPYIQVIGDTARISGTGQITAIVSDYSCPSISAGGWPGIRFSSILESPLWSRMATLFTRWPTFSSSPCPVWRARALPSLRNCSRATLCQPPRDSATMGMNLIPCSLHSSSVSLHLFSNATVNDNDYKTNPPLQGPPCYSCPSSTKCVDYLCQAAWFRTRIVLCV